MTVAICFKCGAFKHGAFSACQECGVMPGNIDDLAISLTLSDHTLDKTTLGFFGSEIRAGRMPSVDQSDVAENRTILSSPAGANLLAMFGWKPNQPTSQSPTRPRRGNGLFQRIGNHREIATVVCRHYRSRNGSVRFRANRFLDPELVMLLKTNFRKPFFSSWSSFLPETVLSDPEAFSVLSSRILITSNAKETPDDFWDGAGNYQDYIKHRDVPAFSGSARIAAFAVLLAEDVYVEIRPYLEIPVGQ